MGKRRQQGFTLLEAIVAMVLIAGAGMALFSWINTNIISLSRVQEINAQAEAQANVLAYMNTVNPMMTPEGKADLGFYRLQWKAEAVTAVQDGANYPYGISLYQLALYRTAIQVEKADGRHWFDMALRQVGYKKVRELRPPF
jgi:general secretion pathway protein I